MSGVTVKGTSGDESVATVDTSGLVTAVAEVDSHDQGAELLISRPWNDPHGISRTAGGEAPGMAARFRPGG